MDPGKYLVMGSYEIIHRSGHDLVVGSSYIIDQILCETMGSSRIIDISLGSTHMSDTYGTSLTRIPISSDPVTSKCLMSLQYQARGCVASGSTEHYYRTHNGREKSLVSISECSCH